VPAGAASLVIGVPQSRQLDPTHNVQALARTLAVERLTRTDAGGRTTPRLLGSWSEVDGGLTWRFALRPGLLYQDGTALTAADVKARIDELREEPPDRTLSVCVPDITDVSVVDVRQFVVRLKRRCALLLEDFDMAITRPTDAGRPPVGTGPFTIVSSTNEEVVLEANRRYYLGAPSIGRVVVRPYDTLRTAWAEMLRGRVDFLWEVGPDTAEFLRDQREVDVRSFLSYYAYTVILNTAHPVLRSPDVRRALNLAIDRAELVQQALKGQGRPGDDPVWPSLWARDAALPRWPFDPGEAARLIGRAVGAAEGAPASADHPLFEFSCLVPAGFTLYERLALLVQRQLRSINVEMRIEALAPDAWLTRIRSGRFDAVLMNLVGGPYRTIYYRFWHSAGASQRWNYWNYADAGVDRALEQMRDAANDGATRAAMRGLSQAFRANPPAVVLAWSETIQAVSRRFDIPDTGAGRDALHVLDKWAIRAPGDLRR